MDPRLNIIDKRLENIKRIVAVSGGKGGIGKSSVASILALCLSEKYKVGLLDLDFYGPSSHVILGIPTCNPCLTGRQASGRKDVYPKEEKGILPPEIYPPTSRRAGGIKFMSIIYYAKDNPLAIRGVDISNAIIELLAITRWDKLDFLIIDMPPGIGDATLDIIRFLKRAEFLVIATSSKVVLETVKKTIRMLKETGVSILGVIENMKFKDSLFIKEAINQFDVRLLGEIGFDKNVEDCIGDKEKLLTSRFAQDIKEIILDYF